MSKKSKHNGSEGDFSSESSSKKKGGIKARLASFLEKLIAYFEIMVLYAQKNLEHSLRKLAISTLLYIIALFFILFSFGYFSYGIFLSLGKYLTNGDPILSSFGTGFVFLILGYLFLRSILKK